MRSEWDELEALKAYLAEIVRAPETCPAFKGGTAWERDRIVQRDIVGRDIARLEAELRPASRNRQTTRCGMRSPPGRPGRARDGRSNPAWRIGRPPPP